MTQPNLVELAKKGDPQAIAALMNRSLQPRGMTATADLNGDRLEVMLESEQIPNRQALTTFVQNGLYNLGIKSISSVKILGKQLGSDMPSWVQELDLGATPGIVPSSEAPLASSSPAQELVSYPSISPTPANPDDSDASLLNATAATSLDDLQSLGNTPNTDNANGVVISAPSTAVDDDQFDSSAGATDLYPDDLLGTHALDHPDDPLEEADDFDEADDRFMDSASGSADAAYPTRETNGVVHPDPLFPELAEPKSQSVLLPASEVVNQSDIPLPGPDTLDYYEGRPAEELVVESPNPPAIAPDAAIASTEPDEPEDEDSSVTIPWSVVVIVLILLWLLLLIGYSLWRAFSNPSPEPELSASPSAMSSPPPLPLPASPSPQTSPILQTSPSPQTSPILQAADDVLPPPAVTCPAAGAASGALGVALTSLKFEEKVPGADGDYVIGCVTNHTNRAIATVSFSFQGNSTQNSAITQNGSTKITFTNLPPQQTVPFRSAFTINPEVNNLAIQSVSWVSAGATQPQQAQTNLKLTR